MKSGAELSELIEKLLCYVKNVPDDRGEFSLEYKDNLIADAEKELASMRSWDAAMQNLRSLQDRVRQCMADGEVKNG